MTQLEKILWAELRNRRFNGWKFRRQHPIEYEILNRCKKFYVADFYCAEKKLVLELDGKHHEFDDEKEYDNARNTIMKEMGRDILRIKNDDFYPLSRTLQRISTALDQH